MNIPAILAVLTLVIGVPLNWYVLVMLRRLSNERPSNRVLRERMTVEQILLPVIIIFGLIFLNNDLPIPIFNNDSTKLITRALMLTLAIVPALRWLRMYRGR